LVAGWSPYEEIEEETNRFIFDKFYDALRKETQSFWNAHNSYLNEDSREEFSEDFKNLFESMVCEDPEKRITIEDLKKDKWYNGEVFSPEELEAELKAILTL
jgi:SNF-related kinase/serine kinase